MCLLYCLIVSWFGCFAFCFLRDICLFVSGGLAYLLVAACFVFGLVILFVVGCMLVWCCTFGFGFVYIWLIVLLLRLLWCYGLFWLRVICDCYYSLVICGLSVICFNGLVLVGVYIYSRFLLVVGFVWFAVFIFCLECWFNSVTCFY